jgi:hypothetical protein
VKKSKVHKNKNRSYIRRKYTYFYVKCFNDHEDISTSLEASIHPSSLSVSLDDPSTSAEIWKYFSTGRQLLCFSGEGFGDEVAAYASATISA